MAIAYPSHIGAGTLDSPSSTIQTSAFECSTGSAIVVCAWGFRGDVLSISGITDSESNTYAELAYGNNGGSRHQFIWLAQNITGNAANQVTVTFSASIDFSRVWAFELTGVALSSAHDTGFAPALNLDSSSPATTTSDDTAEDGEWLIGLFDSQTEDSTFGASDSSVIRHDSYARFCVATKEIATAGSATIGVTFTATTVGCLAAAIKAAAATGQFARPASDVADGDWVSQVPSSINLYQSIDETSFSDTDYIRSGATPSSDTCTIGLSSIATPQAGTVTLRVRARYV